MPRRASNFRRPILIAISEFSFALNFSSGKLYFENGTGLRPNSVVTRVFEHRVPHQIGHKHLHSSPTRDLPLRFARC